MLPLFRWRLRGLGPRARKKGPGEGGMQFCSSQFRCNSLKKLILEKERKGNERSFAVSRACFRRAGASGIGFENSDSWRHGRRICALAEHRGMEPDGGSTRSQPALAVCRTDLFVPSKMLISFGIAFLTNLRNANEINGPKVKSDRLLASGRAGRAAVSRDDRPDFRLNDAFRQRRFALREHLADELRDQSRRDGCGVDVARHRLDRRLDARIGPVILLSYNPILRIRRV